MAKFTYDIRAMLRKFGVVTVMDVKAYKTALHTVADDNYDIGEWDAVNTLYEEDGTTAKTPLFTLDTLKIANINQEGPTKTITGGQNADTLLKYGKTFSIEMQEALGHYDVLDSIYGVNFSDNHQFATFTDRFPSEITLVGTTFVIDQQTGYKQPIHIVIPRFLGDGILNLTQDAEGDATVFDMNGNILKFEGGTVGSNAISTGDDRFSCEDNHGCDGYIYGQGADNEFYFMCTAEGLAALKDGYRSAWTAEADAPADAPATGE